ncbi:GNAT family N-acetyltransferase [Streptomyces sp. NPDC003300]|uniref:GNAT family N-acetyltransferase n=1 Tax=unclassified Streptomyces TaxID=2593676 RepID=UPI00339F5119
MKVIIRQYGPADAEAVAAVGRETVPYMVTTARTVHAQVTDAPEKTRFLMLVAQTGDGRIVGSARAGLFADNDTPGTAFVNLNVRAGERGRGIGGALLAAAESHVAGLGASTVYAWAIDEPSAHAFAARHGYRRGRSASFLRLDLTPGAPLPGVPPLPPGVLLRPASDYAADPRPVYEADAETIEDEPGDVATGVPGYADWRATSWDRSDYDHDLTTVAVVDGVVAAVVNVQTDGHDRYWSGGTGTRRAFRGRGLAKAAKAHSLHRARAAGYTEAFTSNDDGNAAMLAVNRWLGYRPCGNEWRYFRDLSDRP